MQHDPAISEQLRERFPEAVVSASPGPIDPWIEIAPERLAEVAAWLKNDPAQDYDYLNGLCVIDYFTADKKLAEAVGAARLVVVYHLSNLSRKRQLTLKVTLPRWANAASETPPTLPSLAALWATAEWHECEAYDLSGVEFTNHPHLRRILCPEDWVGHPLRKDYQMPLEYHGIRGR
ncbi:NADH-quinone oxidoreductase subunit C [Botrimarina hoheduenensis]|uniref:NADH-quinone oxidoreductase subunit C n=1 Tax=Botrimarina hoheduenensis TaxID=2528000 RepID=A0A5C5WC84_9BACT|nr:NADH-quinone oxidoreductase subunit C [Botrimarina hoheduenensis]TWT48528.1 NADH-quinone oxidoreductase subunit C/D [Botrimarina hoheduenensis]